MFDAFMQVAAICAYGNAFLSKRITTLEALQQLQVVTCTDTFSFERTVPGYRGGSIASTPSAWIRRLASEEVPSIRFSFEKFDYRTPSAAPRANRFAGLLVDGSAGIELWTPEWTFRGERTDGKNWKVAYASERVGRHLFNPPVGPTVADSQWLSALHRMIEATKRGGHATWVGRFESIAGLADTPGPMPERLSAAVPSFGLNVEARRLLANAFRTQTILGSADYAAVRESGELPPMWLDAEKALWRSVGQAYESALYAQTVTLSAAA